MSKYISQVFKIVFAIIIVGVIGGVVFLGFGLVTGLNYTPDKIVERYVKLLDSPTPETVSSQEEKELQDIVDSGFVDNILNQKVSQLKDLRQFRQTKPVKIGNIEYTGSKNYATVTLTFENDFKNPNSKVAKLNLIRQGEYWNGGVKWKVYEITMPQKDNLIDQNRDKLKLPEFQLPSFRLNQ